jgi:hypothetical protein
VGLISHGLGNIKSRIRKTERAFNLFTDLDIDESELCKVSTEAPILQFYYDEIFQNQFLVPLMSETSRLDGEYSVLHNTCTS